MVLPAVFAIREYNISIIRGKIERADETGKGRREKEDGRWAEDSFYLLPSTVCLSTNMNHIQYMTAALIEARKAVSTGDIPIGAVAVHEGKIVARAHNEKEKRGDATAHAELLCLQRAAKKLGTWRLYGITMYTTLEPCPMCAGAMVLARIKELVYAAKDPKAGAAGSIMNLVKNKKLNHRIKITKSVLEQESSSLIKDFFNGLRKK